MKLLVLYRPQSEHARAVDNFVREMQTRSTQEVELVDVDSQEGIRKVELYDAMQYPTVLATTDEGHMQKMWPGTPLPLVNDVVGFLAH
jgi:hypothetical protein